MNISRFIWFLFALVLVNFCCGMSMYPSPKIMGVKYIDITGTTNIHTFKISYSSNLDNELCIYPLLDSLQMVDIQIPVGKMKADNRQMQREFLEMLNSEKYPYISVQGDFYEFKDIRSGSDINLLVNIAGIAREVRFSVMFHPIYSNLYFLESVGSIDLNEFNIETPNKFGGLVNVNSEVNVTFGLYIYLET